MKRILAPILLLTVLFPSIAIAQTYIFIAGGKYCRTFVPAWEFDRMDMEVLIPDCDHLDQILLDQLTRPVIVGGISTGSVKAMQFAIKNNKKIDGVVLISAITTVKCHWCGSLHFTEYAKYKGHILFINHKNDRCPSTNEYHETKRFASYFENNKMILLSGGRDNGGDSLPERCFRNTHHSFSGIEATVTKEIASWIKSLVLK